MAKFFSTGYMNDVSYQNIGGSVEDIQNSFHWDIRWDKFPSTVYYPSDQVFRNRLIDVTVPNTPAIEIKEVRIQGFNNIQPGHVDRSKEITLKFQDFVDQSITYIFLDWQNQIQDPETKQSLKKSQIVCSLTLYQLDRALNPIKSWTCTNGILTNYDSGEKFSSNQDNNGSISATIKFEQVVQKLLNTTIVD